MDCPNCHYLVAPDLKISLQSGLQHCPYCLHLLPDEEDPGSAETGLNGVSVKRFALRRRVREQLADRMIKLSHDRRPACPVCDRRLNKSDEILLRNTEYFRCHSCGHDLASYAYRQEAYHQQRWLPVLYALADLRAEHRCADCCYLGAMARSCQLALSWMPTAPSKHGELVRATLARAEWNLPEGDCLATCGAVDQYRKLAGEGLALL